jgi:hypothetical protein
MKQKINAINLIFILLLSIGFVFVSVFKYDRIPTSAQNALSILESNREIHIEAHILPAEDSVKGTPLMATQQGYSVLALTIENRSSEQFELKKEYIDLDLAERKSVMKKVKRSALIRSLVFRVAGLIFWPASIPGAVDTIISSNSLHSLKNRLHASMLKKEGEILLPFSSIHRYLFIPSDKVPESFTIHLLNCHNLKTESYNVEIA